MNTPEHYIQEDTIDLKELWRIIIKRKTLLLLITFSITLLAIAYVLLAKPIYEARSIVELASINQRLVNNTNDIKQKLEYIFIDVMKSMKKKPETYIESISIPKKTTNLLLLKSHSISKELAKKEIQKLLTSLTEIQDENINTYISLQIKQIELANNDINVTNTTINSILEKKDVYEQMLFKIENDNAALAGIYAIELGKMRTDLNDLYKRISQLNSKKNDLIFSISSNNIKRTAVIGNIEVSNFAIKPKKKLIVIAAFTTGLVLSLFLVFFLEFIQGSKREEDSQ